MRRKKESPGIELYYDSLTEIFCKRSSVLTGVIPHFGERGHNDEMYLLDFLKRVLPSRFSTGTGFIVASDIGKKASPQADIIISDRNYLAGFMQ